MRVILESPHKGNDLAELHDNERYLNRCLAHSCKIGESPYASHRMLTAALEDGNALHRTIGIDAGFEWRAAAEATVVYLDRGVSVGVMQGIRDAIGARQRIVLRAFEPEWLPRSCAQLHDVFPQAVDIEHVHDLDDDWIRMVMQECGVNEHHLQHGAERRDLRMALRKVAGQHPPPRYRVRRGVIELDRLVADRVA